MFGQNQIQAVSSSVNVKNLICPCPAPSDSYTDIRTQNRPQSVKSGNCCGSLHKPLKKNNVKHFQPFYGAKMHAEEYRKSLKCFRWDKLRKCAHSSSVNVMRIFVVTESRMYPFVSFSFHDHGHHPASHVLGRRLLRRL